MVEGLGLLGGFCRGLMTADVPHHRLEEAAANAWPALHQVFLDGWLLRFAKGFTKRANSVTPLYPSSQGIEGKVRHCENLYARERLRSIFRLRPTEEQGALDGYLQARGYRQVGPSLVLTAGLPPSAGKPLGANLGLPSASQPTLAGPQNPMEGRRAISGPDAVAVRAPSAHCFMLTQGEWLQCHAALTGASRKFTRLHGAILNAVRTDCAYAALRDGERTLACGLGVVESGLLGLFDIVTHPRHRRRGWGEELVRSLMHWGRMQGATTAYLQVAADNEAAKALYAKLGFQEQYPYWYRVAR